LAASRIYLATPLYRHTINAMRYSIIINNFY